MSSALVQASNLNTLEAKNKRFKCQRGDTEFLSVLIWSRNFFMKYLVIHRASIWQRCTMFYVFFSHSTVIRHILHSCEHANVFHFCELQPQSSAALMFCVFLEQNFTCRNKTDIKSILLGFQEREEIFETLFPFDRLLIRRSNKTVFLVRVNVFDWSLSPPAAKRFSPINFDVNLKKVVKEIPEVFWAKIKHDFDLMMIH